MQMCECADAWQAAVAIKIKKASQLASLISNHLHISTYAHPEASAYQLFFLILIASK